MALTPRVVPAALCLLLAAVLHAETAGEPALSDPDRLAFLRRQLTAFRALPPDRQRAVRKLHEQLHALPPDAQKEDYHVLREYADWLDGLPDTDRRRVTQAGTAEERLAVIRELREKQFLARLPRRLREELERKSPEERREGIRRWQRERRRADTPAAGPRWGEELPPLPAPFDRPLPRGELLGYVQRQLRPMLTPDEDERLWLAWQGGDAGEFLAAVADLAHRHPVYLPNPEHPPKTLFQELSKRFPRVIIAELRDKDPDGPRSRWPEAALSVARAIRAEGKSLPFPFGASHMSHYPHAVQEAVRKGFTDAQQRELKALEGHWPEFPQRLLTIARERDVHLPGLTPPGPPSFWEKHRTSAGLNP